MTSLIAWVEAHPQEFAEWLRSLRVLSPAQVDARAHARATLISVESGDSDATGPYIPHGGEVHHLPQESRH